MRKQLLALLVVGAMSLPMLFSVAQAAEPLKIPIITYHHLSDNPKDWNPSTVSTSKFKAEMVALKELGYTPIHFKDVLFAEEKAAKLPKYPILITFDDGYLSNYKLAYPILKELDMKATISVIGYNRGRGSQDGEEINQVLRHFSWEQAREMYRSGLIDIQYHTFNLHKSGDGSFFGRGMMPLQYETSEDYQQRLQSDMKEMTRIIEHEVGNEVIVCTYPFGLYTSDSEKIAKKNGLKFTLTTKEGISNLSSSHYLLQRLNMDAFSSSYDLMKRILQADGRNEKIPLEQIYKEELLANPLSDSSTSISGRSLPGNTVFAAVGRKMLGLTTVKADGTYSLSIPRQEAGKFVVLTTSHQDGLITANSRVFVEDLTPPIKPEIRKVDEKTGVIKGVGERGSTIILKVKGKVISQVKVNSKGEFSLKMTGYKPGVVLSIVAKDRVGNVTYLTYSGPKIVKKV
jgi:peptidoglycan/xylan/chitin deacetylase (PgdA/CDA1 family)